MSGGPGISHASWRCVRMRPFAGRRTRRPDREADLAARRSAFVSRDGRTSVAGLRPVVPRGRPADSRNPPLARSRVPRVGRAGHPSRLLAMRTDAALRRETNSPAGRRLDHLDREADLAARRPAFVAPRRTSERGGTAPGSPSRSPGGLPKPAARREPSPLYWAGQASLTPLGDAELEATLAGKIAPSASNLPRSPSRRRSPAPRMSGPRPWNAPLRRGDRGP